jgi:hypothetical protein
MQAYIQQQLEWGGFWKLLEFAIKVRSGKIARWVKCFLIHSHSLQHASHACTLVGTWLLPCTLSQVEKLLYADGLGASEVSFQPGCSTSDAKSLVNSTMKEVGGW